MKTKANLALDFPVLKESNFLGFMDQCRKTIMAEQHSNLSRLLEMELKKKKRNLFLMIRSGWVNWVNYHWQQGDVSFPVFHSLFYHLLCLSNLGLNSQITFNFIMGNLMETLTNNKILYLLIKQTRKDYTRWHYKDLHFLKNFW